MDPHSVLLVDRSAIVRELVTLHLRSRGFKAEAVATTREAGQRLATASPGYVVLEAGEGGLTLLRRIAQLEDPRPHVIVTSLRPSLGEETLASMEGAIAYLAKPLRLTELSRAMGAWPLVFPVSPSRRSPRARPLRALLCDPEHDNAAVVACDVHDLSAEGALLLTHAPLAEGRSLVLELCVGDDRHRLAASVVRVQEPSWGAPAGVGVAFEGLSASQRRSLERLVVRPPPG